MIERTDHDGIHVLRMAHGKANAIDVEFARGLREQLRASAEDARAIVLTGTGRIFSAGVDLPRLLREDDAYVDALVEEFTSLFRDLFLLPLPVVGAVNGHAIAGGCLLAMACDYRIGVEGRWRIGTPELPVGVAFPTVALEIVRFAAPSRTLSSLLYLGTTWRADDACRHGLIEELAPEAEFTEAARARAGEMGALLPQAFALTKRALRMPTADRMESVGERVEAGIRAQWRAPATRAAIQAYVDRTLGPRS